MIEKTSTFTTSKKNRERCLLVGVRWAKMKLWEVEDHLAELSRLVETAGGEVVYGTLQERYRPDPKTFIGSGKVEEIAFLVKDLEVDIVVFDDPLTPAQQRNLQVAFDTMVIDREGLILDIFSQRARTREGKLQVELAQYQYLYPRLTRMWGHLDRHAGGIGTRGPGETQLETDRRLIQGKISKLKAELKRVEKMRGLHRRNRKRNEVPIVALVGYTNAGKSTLFNRLSGAEVYAKDELFATLDATVRKAYISAELQVLLIDTVGFIRKLPHQLVAAFKSTLEEVNEADLILHIVDTPHPSHEEQMRVVEQVLKELGVEETPKMLVFNKTDLLEGTPPSFVPGHSIAVSAMTGDGVDLLKEELQFFFEDAEREQKLREQERQEQRDSQEQDDLE